MLLGLREHLLPLTKQFRRMAGEAIDGLRLRVEHLACLSAQSVTATVTHASRQQRTMASIPQRIKGRHGRPHRSLTSGDIRCGSCASVHEQIKINVSGFLADAARKPTEPILKLDPAELFIAAWTSGEAH